MLKVELKNLIYTNMTYKEFVTKLVELNGEFQLAVFNMDYSEIERVSKRIGRLVVRFLDQNKMRVEK